MTKSSRTLSVLALAVVSALCVVGVSGAVSRVPKEGWATVYEGIGSSSCETDSIDGCGKGKRRAKVACLKAGKGAAAVGLFAGLSARVLMDKGAEVNLMSESIHETHPVSRT